MATLAIRGIQSMFIYVGPPHSAAFCRADLPPTCATALFWRCHCRAPPLRRSATPPFCHSAAPPHCCRLRHHYCTCCFLIPQSPPHHPPPPPSPPTAPRRPLPPLPPSTRDIKTWARRSPTRTKASSRPPSRARRAAPPSSRIARRSKSSPSHRTTSRGATHRSVRRSDHVLASYYTRHIPFLHRYSRTCTYVHLLYMYIHNIYI